MPQVTGICHRYWHLNHLHLQSWHSALGYNNVADIGFLTLIIWQLWTLFQSRSEQTDALCIFLEKDLPLWDYILHCTQITLEWDFINISSWENPKSLVTQHQYTFCRMIHLFYILNILIYNRMCHLLNILSEYKKCHYNMSYLRQNIRNVSHKKSGDQRKRSEYARTSILPLQMW